MNIFLARKTHHHSDCFGRVESNHFDGCYFKMVLGRATVTEVGLNLKRLVWKGYKKGEMVRTLKKSTLALRRRLAYSEYSLRSLGARTSVRVNLEYFYLCLGGILAVREARFCGILARRIARGEVQFLESKKSEGLRGLARTFVHGEQNFIGRCCGEFGTKFGRAER